MSDFERLLGALQQTGYHQWMKSESIPVVVGHGMDTFAKTSPPLEAHGRLGCFRSSSRHGSKKTRDALGHAAGRRSMKPTKRPIRGRSRIDHANIGS